jgi:hypothetical protein
MRDEFNEMPKEVKEALLSVVSSKELVFDEEILKFKEVVKTKGMEFFFNEETFEIDMRVVGDTSFESNGTTILVREATVEWNASSMMKLILKDGTEVMDRSVKGLKKGDELLLHLFDTGEYFKVLKIFVK